MNLLITIIAMIIINWKHAGSKGLILYIFLLIFNILNEIFLILIFIFLYKNKKKSNIRSHSRIINLLFIGMVFSICILIIFFITEIIIKANFNDLDFPCRKYNSVSLSFFRNLQTINDKSDKDDLCESLDKNYDTKTTNKKEHFILYFNSTIVEILSLINTCLWANFLKRFKNKVEESMIKHIHYMGKLPIQNMRNPYGNNIIIKKGDGVGIKQVNIIQNNYKGIFTQYIPNQKESKKHLTINHISTKTNDTINLSTMKDKSKDILYEKRIIKFNSLNKILK
jgi:hypothetical protein